MASSPAAGAPRCLYGYPVLVDGTAAGGTGVDLVDVWGIEFARNAVQFANLLPMSPYRMLISSGLVCDASFVVGLDGSITLTQGATYKLTSDSFNGVPRVRLSK